ncbi:MAG: pantoate--beta-alanine ligase [Thermaurantiacus sp.]
MRRCETAVALAERVAEWRHAGDRIALVPTMGALHRGHLALLAAARSHADRVVASIFVNPAQFGEGEDFDRYPRQMEADTEMLREAGCDLLFAPSVAEVYPAGFSTRVRVQGLSERWCGADRPGHFDGVATVVTRLLLIALPDVVLLGEKDWQQLAIIRRLVRDLGLRVSVVGVPTVRDRDGLALSSRNAYLSAGERQAALALPRALKTAAAQIAGGMDARLALDGAGAAIRDAGFSTIDYLALIDEETLQPLDRWQPGARLLAAARIGTTRLIDNLAVTRP